MEIYIASGIASLIGAGVGAYFGGYLKKKGENLATHEDIDKLLEQVRAVTTTTKEIEAQISGGLWDRQKRWELKREVLFQAAKRVSELADALHTYDAYLQMKTAQVKLGNNISLELGAETSTRWDKAIADFNETGVFLRIICGDETFAAFNSYHGVMRKNGSRIIGGDCGAFDQFQAERKQKLLAVTAAMRKELEIDKAT